MEALESRLGHPFRQPELLLEALTHPSWSHEAGRHHRHNQRLEFLGDAVLQLVCSQWALELFPAAPEGVLTQWRAQFVSTDFLCEVAHALELPRHLRMGRGEIAQGGLQKANALADAFEAVVGALFMDAGYGAVEACLRCLMLPLMQSRPVPAETQNPKGQLQEQLQRLAPESPVYQVTMLQNAPLPPRFRASVYWQSHLLGEGEGPSKKRAEMAAASSALRDLNNHVNDLEKGRSSCA